MALRQAGGDPVSRVRDALVEAYAMSEVPEEEGFLMGPGWRVENYLVRTAPMPTRDDVLAKVVGACGDCVVDDYFGESFMVAHDDDMMSDAGPGGGPGYSRFLLVTWEGPLDGADDGGLVVAFVQKSE